MGFVVILFAWMSIDSMAVRNHSGNGSHTPDREGRPKVNSDSMFARAEQNSNLKKEFNDLDSEATKLAPMDDALAKVIKDGKLSLNMDCVVHTPGNEPPYVKFKGTLLSLPYVRDNAQNELRFFPIMESPDDSEVIKKVRARYRRYFDLVEKKQGQQACMESDLEPEDKRNGYEHKAFGKDVGLYYVRKSFRGPINVGRPGPAAEVKDPLKANKEIISFYKTGKSSYTMKITEYDETGANFVRVTYCK